MSPRREGRESEAKRSRSKSGRDPSPKRARRDGKPKTERNTSRNYDLDTLHSNDHDHKPQRRLKDALPLEAPVELESKVGSENASSDLKRNTNTKEYNDIKPSFDPTEVPRSRSYFQHDERDRGFYGQGGRSFNRRATNDRGGWTNRKDRYNEKPGDHRDDARDSHRRRDENIWRHDRYHEEQESDAPPPARKRPAFREKKIEQEVGSSAQITGTDSTRSTRRIDRSVSENGRRESWGGRHPYDRAPPPLRRERYGGGSMGRDRFSGRRYEEDRDDFNNDDTEIWKHDKFDEANKSPSPKKAEEQIAKVEALLAS